jgi:hypothetical protein
MVKDLRCSWVVGCKKPEEEDVNWRKTDKEQLRLHCVALLARIFEMFYDVCSGSLVCRIV